MFSFTLERLALGTYRNLVTCSLSSNLVDVLRAMDRTHFASIPIVDAQGRLVDVFYKSMITVRRPSLLVLDVEHLTTPPFSMCRI